MTYRYLTDLATVLRKAGLTVVELDGWQTRGRPESTGAFDPQGNLWHHTGGDANGRTYADWMARTGRSDLPAPLCQVAIDRQGVCYVSAAGRANHAGRAKAAGPCPAGDGNALYLGFECMNNGTEGWTAAQYDAMVKAAAATSKHYGWTAAHNRGHRETSETGKWDPGMLDLAEFRDDIHEAMRTVPTKAQRKKARQKINAITAKTERVAEWMRKRRVPGADRLEKAIRDHAGAKRKTHRK